jgi:hypothetical protein
MVVVVHDDEGGGLLGVHQEVLGLPHIHQTLEGVLLLTLLVFHVGCGGGTGVPVLALVDNLSHLILLLPPTTATLSPYLLVDLLQLLGLAPNRCTRDVYRWSMKRSLSRSSSFSRRTRCSSFLDCRSLSCDFCMSAR